MKQGIFTVLENRSLNASVFEMKLAGDTSAVTAPGQFVNIHLDGLYLRRPISVCDKEGDTLTLIYKVIGAGTSQMARMRAGETLDCLTGLGNGYDLNIDAKHIYVLGGGVGIPPLYGLVKELRRRGKHPEVRIGFNTRADAFYCAAFRSLTPDFGVYSIDGSIGAKGYVTDALDDPRMDYFFACGPLPMLRAVCRIAGCGGQVSLEERMGCGFGACMGCSIQTVNGPRRVCREGPIFKKEELLWDD